MIYCPWHVITSFLRSKNSWKGTKKSEGSSLRSVSPAVPPPQDRVSPCPPTPPPHPELCTAAGPQGEISFRGCCPPGTGHPEPCASTAAACLGRARGHPAVSQSPHQEEKNPPPLPWAQIQTYTGTLDIASGASYEASS